MQKFSRKIATLLMVAAFAAPIVASAQATTTGGVSNDMQAQIQALLSQIKILQAQIKNILASSTGGMGGGMGMGWNNGSSTGMMPMGQMGKMACITLTRSLHQGDSGDDVMSLQQMLQQDPNSGFTGNA